MAWQVALLVLQSCFRAASAKGCFLGSSPVSMADGSQRRLDQVQVGDEVLSWDVGRQQAVSSTVIHVPRFQRLGREMVTLSLPHGKLLATEDHPFWSRGRGLLVSMQPNATAAEYGLKAEVMQVGETLESSSLQNIQVLDIERPSSAISSKTIEVATLCLQPFHWFYVNGVRVHNKGCFAPWVRVLMSDGSHKRIADIREQDTVVSWDSDHGQLSEAAVVGVDSFPPHDLYQILYDPVTNASELHSSSWAENPVATDSNVLELTRDATLPGRLVLTADHPVYSSRLGGLVSMRPSKTQELYGLAAMQMQEREILRHHSGQEMKVSVRPWNGSDVPFVMTLRLDQHHWFYAEGVRVHNKGGHGGHGGHFGGHYGGHRGYYGGFRSWTRSGSIKPHAYAALVVLSMRRRYGTWYNSSLDDCRVKSIYATKPANASSGSTTIAADGGHPLVVVNETQQLGKYLNGTAALDELCTDTVGFYASCSRCNSCADTKCVQSIPGCDKFLGEVYDECVSHPTAGDSYGSLLTMGAIFIGCGLCWCIFNATHSNDYQYGSDGGVAALRQKRTGLRGVNGIGLVGDMQFGGTYAERGEVKPTSYQWRMTESGIFAGTGRDDDGVAQVQGAMRWTGGDRGDIMWSEERPGASLEVEGFIGYAAGGELQIQAKYVSSTGVQGKLNLRSVAGFGQQDPLLG